MRLFKRNKDGTVVVRLDESQRDVLAQLLDQSRMLSEVDRDSTWRLNPPTYEDPVEQAEYQLDIRRNYHDQSAANDELFSSAAGLIRTTKTLSQDEAELVLAAINKVRLILGTMANIQDDGGIEDTADERIRLLFNYYQFTTGIISYLIDAMW